MSVQNRGMVTMKARICLILFGMIPGLCFALGNPVGSATEPPSSFRSGLVDSPNPLDSSSELSVTGNVTGLGYFHGFVPYRPSYEFRGRLGTSDFDSFLRRSVGSEDYSYTGQSRPFFSRSRIVSSTRPGESFIRSYSPKVSDRISDKSESTYIGGVRSEDVGTLSSSAQQGYLEQLGGVSESFLRSPRAARYYQNALQQKQTGVERYMGLSRNSELFLDDRIIGKMGPENRFDVELRSEEFESEDFGYRYPGHGRRYESEQIERYVPGEQEGMRSAFLEQRSIFQESPAQADERADMANISRRYSLLETQRMERGTGESYTESKLLEQDLESVKGRQDKGAVSDFSFIQAVGKAGRADGQNFFENDMFDFEKPYGESDKQDKSVRALNESELGLDTSSNVSNELFNLEENRQALYEEPDEEDIQRARSLLDSYPDFDSFLEDSYRKQIRSAEQLLKQGRYYSAADSYTLASAYLQGRPQVFAGKAHALFAAGEYMSSSLFVRRALETLAESKAGSGKDLDKQIIKFASNLLMVERDTLESRVVELERLQKSHNSAELEFLLAYVYHQMGRKEAAQRAVDSLSRKMPKERSVFLLKKIIHTSQK